MNPAHEEMNAACCEIVAALRGMNTAQEEMNAAVREIVTVVRGYDTGIQRNEDGSTRNRPVTWRNKGGMVRI